MALWQTSFVLLTFVVWLHSTPLSLADAARREALRRRLVSSAAVSLTNEHVQGLPYRPPPGVATQLVDGGPGARAAPEPPDDAAPASEPRGEAWWRARMAQARAALERDHLLAEALQSRVNALTADWSARDDPAQRQQLYDERIRVLEALDRMLEQVAADREALAGIEEDARGANVPPGWMR